MIQFNTAVFLSNNTLFRTLKPTGFALETVYNIQKGVDIVTVYLYADVMLLISVIVNIPILWSTARAYGLRFSVIRSVLASLLSGISSIAVVCCKFDITKALIVYIFVFIISVYIAFGKNRIEIVLRIAFMLLWHCTILSGACNVINMTLHNEVREYISIVCVIIGTIIFCIAVRMRKSAYAVSVAALKINICKLRIKINGDEYILTTVIDSGNMLVEPLSQCPVIVVSNKNKSLCKCVENCKNKRFAPFATLAGNGIIECAAAQAWMYENNEALGDVYIGVSKNMDYEAVVGTAVFNMRSGVKINE